MIESLFGVNTSSASPILRLAVGSLVMVHGYPKMGSKQRQQGGAWLKSHGIPSWMMGFAGVAEFLEE